jgi:hypothetical protein
MILRHLLFVLAFITFIGDSSINAQPLFRWADALPGLSSPSMGEQNQVSSVSVNKKGEVYVVGSFNSGIDMDPGASTDSVVCNAGSSFASYLGKYDSSGHFIWSHCFGPGGGITSYIDDSGHLYIGGYIGGVDSLSILGMDTISTPGFFIAKYDSLDNLLWAKVTGSLAGGDQVLALKVDHSGNIYATGPFTGTVDFDPVHPGTIVFSSSLKDAFVAKYDPNGNLIWARQINGNDGDQGVGLDLDPFGNVLVTGYTGGFGAINIPFGDTGGVYRTLQCHGGYDGFVAKYNANGAIMWLRAIGGQGDDFGQSIVTDASGNVYASGYYSGIMIADSASNDTLNVWNNIGGYLVKFSASGNFIWAKSYGTDSGQSYNAEAVSLAKDDTSNIYLAGSFQKSVILDPSGPAVTQLGGTIGYGEDYYVVKLDSGGNFKWYIHNYSKRDDEPAQIILDAANNIYIGGYITDTTDFNSGGTGGLVGFPMPYPGWVPVSFFCKYTQQRPTDTATGISVVENNTFSIFPNPVKEELILKGTISNTATISVFDILGKHYDIPAIIQTNKAIIAMQSLAPGVYILQYSDAGILPFRTKFVKN